MPFDPAELSSLLNEEQLAAVLHDAGPLLLLAGAGSGKTRVITYRIAHAIVARGLEPWRVLAVTFTNKAAGEMRDRLHTLIGPRAAEAWVLTFHATGARLLRRDGALIGLNPRFVVYDDGDQMSEMKRLIKASGSEAARLEPRAVLSRIDDAKNHGLAPHEVKQGDRDPLSRHFPELYHRYQASLARANAVDFGDLLVRSLELLRAAPELAARYRDRFRLVLVDEFQDTNDVQFRLLRELAGDGQGLCVVGDDDQAIYRWRGADVRHLLGFQQTFPETTIVKLERNYRSTQTVLDAAHAVISRNSRRMEKRMWTDAAGGPPLRLLVAHDERDEADRVAAGASRAIAAGTSPAEIAVFYRTNAQSRVLEEAFRKARLPYTIVRGRSFYDRAEVKDLSSYLRLAVNPRSDADARRVINVPTRGLGDTSVERIEAFAVAQGTTLLEACAAAARAPGLSARAIKSAQLFARIIGELAERALTDAAGEVARFALHRSGLQDGFTATGTEEALERLENVQELVGAAELFDGEWEPEIDPARPDLEPPLPLAAFLERIALLGDADGKVEGPRVSLMTLHAAKGLEFREVFVTGLEEGVFPHSRSLGPDGGPEAIAEERRLCYVALTRAKQQLTLSLAQSRSLYGDLRFNPPSRFLGEIPRELFEGVGLAPAARVSKLAPVGEHVVYDEDAPSSGFEDGPALDEADGFDDGPVIDRSPDVRAQAPLRRPAATLGRGAAGLRVGARVRHERFGVGVIIDADGDKLSVKFSTGGLRRIVARFVEPA